MQGIQQIHEIDRLYHKMMRTIKKNNPLNDVKRVVSAEKYLLNIILTYRSKPGKLQDNIVRGICGEIMFEIICEYYRNYFSNFVLLRNLVLPKDESTTQLDFVIMSPRSIIVVEVKSLFGNIEIEDDTVTNSWKQGEEWISRDIKPWNQNMMHIIAMKNYLQENNTHIHNGVFFFGAGEIRKANPRQDYHLMTLDNTMHMIDNLIHGKAMGNPIPKNRMSQMIKLLKQTIPTPEEELNHIKNVQKIYGT